jgi:hypothetical protein
MEFHGIDALIGPGRLTASTRVLSMSTRRSVVEVVIETSTASAVSHVGFAVRDQPEAANSTSSATADTAAATPEIIIESPLREAIGVVLIGPGHSSIKLDRCVANHLLALQGGATAALIEAAVYGDGTEPGLFMDASINYWAQARGDSVEANVVHNQGGVSVVDVFTRPTGVLIARAVLRRSTA